jgi:translation initiation factor IF-3
VNEAIRVREVRLIGADGENVGTVPTRTALQMAHEKGLDLVEVAPDAHPPVCRIMDFGKFKYEQAKREKEAKKKLHQVEVKEIRLRPKIEKHDLETKLKFVREFIDEGNKVQFTVMFRGREIAFAERAIEMLQSIVAEFGDAVKIEREPLIEGKRLIMIIAPTKAHV